MQENNEIALNEIVSAIVRKWKTVVIFAVIFALLLGGYKFLTIYKQTKSTPSVSVYNNSIANPSENYFANDKTAFDEFLSNNYEKYKSISKYISESYYYNLDFSNCAQSTVIIYVKSTDETTATEITAAISDKINYADASGYAKNTDIGDLDPVYIRELVHCKTDINKQDNEEVDSPNLHIAALIAYAADTETSGKIAMNVLKELDGYINSLKGTWGNFEVFYSENESGYFVNTELMEYQNTINSRLNNAINAVDNAKKNLDTRGFILNEKEQAKYEEMEAELIEEKIKEAEKNPVSVSSMIKASLKMTLLGFIAGALIGCVCIFIHVIVKPTVYSSRQFEKTMKFIGNASANDEKGMNKLADIIAGEKEFRTDRTSRLQYIASYLDNLSKNHKIMLTGTVSEETANRFLNEIKILAPDCNIIYSGNIALSPRAVFDINDCDGIVLIEKKNQSYTKDVYKLYSNALAFNKSMDGYIIL